MRRINLRGRRDKVGPALPDRLRVIDQPQVGFVENGGRLQRVAGRAPGSCNGGRAGAVQDAPAGITFSSASSSPLLHSPSSWVTSCRVDEGVVIQVLDAANCITIERFLQHDRRRSKKAAQSWRVSAGLSAYAHEPAQITSPPEENQT